MSHHAWIGKPLVLQASAEAAIAAEREAHAETRRLLRDLKVATRKLVIASKTGRTVPEKTLAVYSALVRAAARLEAAGVHDSDARVEPGGREPQS